MSLNTLSVIPVPSVRQTKRKGSQHVPHGSFVITTRTSIVTVAYSRVKYYVMGASTSSVCSGTIHPWSMRKWNVRWNWVDYHVGKRMGMITHHSLRCLSFVHRILILMQRPWHHRQVQRQLHPYHAVRIRRMSSSSSGIIK